MSSGNSGTTYAYKKNPAERVVYGTTKTAYAGTDLTSGTTEIDVKKEISSRWQILYLAKCRMLDITQLKLEISKRLLKE